MDSKGRCTTQSLLDVERAVSHFFAHGLNNAIGAVEAYTEMLSEDVGDASSAHVHTDIEKMKRAITQAKAQIHVMRRVIPKHTDDDLGVDLSHALGDVQTLISPQGASLAVSLPSQDVVVDGPVAAVTFVLYHLVSHVVACAPGVTANIEVTVRGDQAHIAISSHAKMEPLFWERPLWDDAVAAFGGRVEPMADARGNGGFVLHWPIISV